MKSREECWRRRILDTMGVAYLIKLIREETVSAEDLKKLSEILDQKISTSDIRVEGSVLYIKDIEIDLTTLNIESIPVEEIDKLFN